MLSDTHPEAEKVQIELLREMTIAQRLGRMRSLSAMVVKLSRRAIARAHPELTPREVDLMWVHWHYGEELAREIREYLENQSPCSVRTQ